MFSFVCVVVGLFSFFNSSLGILLWHAHRMVAFLQQVVLLLSLDCEWLAAVHWLALRGCCHGQLVWKSWVS